MFYVQPLLLYIENESHHDYYSHISASLSLSSKCNGALLIALIYELALMKLMILQKKRELQSAQKKGTLLKLSIENDKTGLGIPINPSFMSFTKKNIRGCFLINVHTIL